jgi:hypothetical protein
MAFIKFNAGLNTAADRSYLAPGELTRATGIYYRPGDTERMWKILGRTSYGDAYGTAQSGIGVAYFAFDTVANDRLVVVNDNGEYHSSVVSATDPTSGTFTTLTTGLNTGATGLTWAHFDDHWYFCDGKNRPLRMEPGGTVRPIGLYPPLEAPVVSTELVTSLSSRATTVTTDGGSGSWLNVTFGYDEPPAAQGSGNLADYFRAWLSSAAIANWDPYTQAITLNEERTYELSGWAADTATTDRRLHLLWGVNVSGQQSDVGLGGGVGERQFPIFTYEGAAEPAGRIYDFEVKMEISEDGGSTVARTVYSWQASYALTSSINAPLATSAPITDGIDLANVVVTITVKNQIDPTEMTPNLVQIFHTEITNAGWAGTISTEAGIHYAISEGIQEDGLIGPYGPHSGLVTFTDINAVRLTLPSAQANPHATHWAIWRTIDASAPGSGYRFLEWVDISETSWNDPMTRPLNSTAGEPPPLMNIAGRYHQINYPPGVWTAITEYDTNMVALAAHAPRQLAYSYPSRPEWWPPFYVVTDFPLKEHDQLKALAVAGDLLIVGATANIIVVNGLPDAEDLKSLLTSKPTVLRGAPGCVGPYAMLGYSLHGEPRVMWVSEQGVYETNGNQVWEISTKLNWAAAVSQGNLDKTWLHWDRDLQIMEMGVDTDGDGLTDRSYYFHMSDEHRSGSGGRGLPKITGPHYMNAANKVSAQANDGRYRIYSLDNDETGEVFHEKDGGTDAGNFFNTLSEVPLDVVGARAYGPDLTEWAADFPTVRHTSWGATPMTMTWKVGRDIGEEEDVTVTLTMSSQKQTKFAVARSGEWHEIRLVHNGDASTSGALGHIEFGPTIMGETGDTADS